MAAYEWHGLHTNISANVVGKEVERIEMRDGFVTPDSLLEDAEPENSPLHGLFEWDNTVAATKYRKMQAGHILRALVIKHEQSPKPITVRAFVNVPEKKNPKYVNINIAMAEPESRTAILERALAELNWFRKKYENLKELASVFAELDKIAI